MVNILIVDDDLVFRRTLAARTEMIPQTRVYDVGDATEALVRLAQVPISLLITDYEMPDMDGFTLLSYIKKMRDKCPYALLLSGRDLSTDLRLRDSGAIACFDKASQLNELHDYVGRFAASWTGTKDSALSFGVSATGVILCVNSPIQRFVGYAADELLGRNFKNFIAKLPAYSGDLELNLIEAWTRTSIIKSLTMVCKDSSYQNVRIEISASKSMTSVAYTITVLPIVDDQVDQDH